MYDSQQVKTLSYSDQILQFSVLCSSMVAYQGYS